MKLELRTVDQSNFLECAFWEGAPKQRQYIATNDLPFPATIHLALGKTGI